MSQETTRDLGQERLAVFLLPGEVLITNLTKDNAIRRQRYDAPEWGVMPEDVSTFEEEVAMYRDSDEYSDVRVVDVAFAKDGTLLTTYVSLVGVLNKVAETAAV